MADPAQQLDPAVERFKEDMSEFFEEHERRLERAEEGLDDAFARMEEVEEVTSKAVRRAEGAAKALNAALVRVPRTTREKLLHEAQAVAITTGRALLGFAVIALPVALIVLLASRKTTQR